MANRSARMAALALAVVVTALVVFALTGVRPGPPDLAGTRLRSGGGVPADTAVTVPSPADGGYPGAALRPTPSVEGLEHAAPFLPADGPGDAAGYPGYPPPQPIVTPSPTAALDDDGLLAPPEGICDVIEIREDSPHAELLERLQRDLDAWDADGLAMRVDPEQGLRLEGGTLSGDVGPEGGIAIDAATARALLGDLLYGRDDRTVVQGYLEAASEPGGDGACLQVVTWPWVGPVSVLLPPDSAHYGDGPIELGGGAAVWRLCATAEGAWVWSEWRQDASYYDLVEQLATSGVSAEYRLVRPSQPNGTLTYSNSLFRFEYPETARLDRYDEGRTIVVAPEDLDCLPEVGDFSRQSVSVEVEDDGSATDLDAWAAREIARPDSSPEIPPRKVLREEALDLGDAAVRVRALRMQIAEPLNENEDDDLEYVVLLFVHNGVGVRIRGNGDPSLFDQVVGSLHVYTDPDRE